MNRITLYGFYMYDSTLFDDVTVPDGIEKDVIIDTIMQNSGDLYTYHQHPTYLKLNITNWFNYRMYSNFEKMYAALTAEYDPIENYDRTETHTISRTSTNSGTDTTTNNTSTSGTNSATTSGSNSGTDTNTKATMDSSEYLPFTQDTTSGETSSETSGSNTGESESTQTLEHGHTITDSESNTIYAHGNIGITTNVAMIKEELALRKFDLYSEIAKMFENEFLIQVY